MGDFSVRGSARWRPQAPIILVVIGLCVASIYGATQIWQGRRAVHVTASLYERKHDELVRHVNAMKKEILKHSDHCSSSVVRQKHINHKAREGSACEDLQPWRLNLDYSKLNSTSFIRSTNAGAADPAAQLISPVVVLSHDRVNYLAKTMTTLLQHWSADPNNEVRFPLFISIDGSYQQTLLYATALTAAAKVQVIQKLRGDEPCDTLTDGYCWLAHHYKMLLELFFVCLQAPRLIFLEEDLETAPDFFPYFAAAAPIMDSDPSIHCVSAWNDQGQVGRVSNATAVYRTDVMPGLGWMMPAHMGLEFLPKWPRSGWDEILRDQRHIKGRQCMFPEVARTHTFGKVGASEGIGYDEHLAVMKLNKEPVDWSQLDLSYLQKDRYAALMQSWLAAAVPLDAQQLENLQEFCKASQPADSDTRDLLIVYNDNEHYSRLAGKMPPMMWDISHGGKVPRASYHGTVMVRCRGRRLFLVHKDTQRGKLL